MKALLFYLLASAWPMIFAVVAIAIAMGDGTVQGTAYQLQYIADRLGNLL